MNAMKFSCTAHVIRLYTHGRMQCAVYLYIYFRPFLKFMILLTEERESIEAAAKRSPTVKWFFKL